MSAPQDYVRTGRHPITLPMPTKPRASRSIILPAERIELRPGTGRTICEHCERPTGSAAYDCQKCGRRRTLKKDLDRYTYNPPGSNRVPAKKLVKLRQLLARQVQVQTELMQIAEEIQAALA